MAANTLDWVGHSLASGRYRVTALLGEGGMGAVYKAQDANLDSEVVVKVPKPGLVSDHEFTARFAREVRSLVRLAHAHIVRVLDVGEHEGLPFAVMQYLNGGSLRDRLSALPGGPAALADLPSWLPGVADALDYIHLQGYVHRDVKPDNVLFDATGHVYLGDFGIAKALAASESNAGPDATFRTSAGLVVGTPRYMAPELITAQGCDGRVDQYALAVTVYEAVCAQVPFDGPTPAALAVLHATKPPRPPHEVAPGIPLSFSMAMLRGLSKEPNHRFRDCRSLAQALVAALPTADRLPYDLTPASSLEEAKERFTCPHCSLAFRLPPEKRGKVGRCPRCQQKFIIGAAAATAETPAGGLAATSLASPAAAAVPASPPSMAPRRAMPPSRPTTQPAAEQTQNADRPLTVMPGDPPRRKRRWILLGCIASLFLVLLVTGLGVWLMLGLFGGSWGTKGQPGFAEQPRKGTQAGGPDHVAADLPLDQLIDCLATRKDFDKPENWNRLFEIAQGMTGRASQIAERKWELPALDYQSFPTSREQPKVGWKQRKVCMDGSTEYLNSLDDCLLVSGDSVQQIAHITRSIVFIDGDLEGSNVIQDSLLFCKGKIGNVNSLRNSIILARSDFINFNHAENCFFQVRSVGNHNRAIQNVFVNLDPFKWPRAKDNKFIRTDQGPLQTVTFFTLARLGLVLYPERESVRIKEIVNDTPFARAGLRGGDDVVALEQLGNPGPRQLFKELRRRLPGEQILLKVRRGDAIVECKVTLAD